MESGKRRHYDRPVNWCCTARASAKSHKLLENLLGLLEKSYSSYRYILANNYSLVNQTVFPS